MSPGRTPSGHLDAAAVRAKLDLGFELIYYKATRNTFAGWGIDGYSVHGATVNAMISRGEIKTYPARAGESHRPHSKKDRHMRKYVLLMKDQANSPVRWHCAFDAEDYAGACEFALKVVREGFSHNQPVDLIHNGVPLAAIEFVSTGLMVRPL